MSVSHQAVSPGWSLTSAIVVLVWDECNWKNISCKASSVPIPSSSHPQNGKAGPWQVPSPQPPNLSANSWIAARDRGSSKLRGSLWGPGPRLAPLYSGSPEIFWGHIPLSQQLFSFFRFFPALSPQQSLQCPGCSLCPNTLLPLPLLPSRPARSRFPLPTPMPGLCSCVPVIIAWVALLIYCPLSVPHPQPGSTFVREGIVPSLPLRTEALGLLSDKCLIHICWNDTEAEVREGFLSPKGAVSVSLGLQS